MALLKIGAGHEHVGGVSHHECKIGHSRTVNRPACAGPHNARNLGDYSTGHDIAIEYFSVSSQGITRDPNHIWTFIITAIAVANSIFAIYVAVGTMTTQILRGMHVAVALTPPVMGAAAFLIAEFLRITYLDVSTMAIIPASLYYWSLLLMVEFDSRKFGMTLVESENPQSLKSLSLAYGYLFFPVLTIVAFLVSGYTPQMAVFFAIAVCITCCFIRRETWLIPRKLVDALKGGTLAVLNVAAVCACAGSCQAWNSRFCGAHVSFSITRYCLRSHHRRHCHRLPLQPLPVETLTRRP